MGIDYLMGFRDATKAFEEETNRIIASIKHGTKEEMANAIDALIASVYVLRLRYEMMEEELLEDMEEDIECEDCDYVDICEIMFDGLEMLRRDF